MLIYDIYFLFPTYFTLYNRLIHFIRSSSYVSPFMAEQYSIVCTYHSFFIHSSVDGHLGHFHVLLLLLLLLSRFSRVRLCVTPWTAAHQAPPSMGFSRQEYWRSYRSPKSWDQVNANIPFCDVFVDFCKFACRLILCTMICTCRSA